jgi:iron(III) transport system ATP-binding protein
MSLVMLQEVSKRYPGCPQPAVDEVTFSVAAGEIVALLGPSGCGKTTVLRLIAGFEHPDAGEIALGERTIAAAGLFVPPERRGVGMVFQDHALFPHLDVARNVGFGLRRGDEGRQAVASMLGMVGLQGLERRLPGELSGGQQQRVALARALVRRPLVVLLDEPFSSLDADLRDQMRSEVRGLLKTTGATALLVTHDRADALAVADRSVYMAAGSIAECPGVARETVMPCHQGRPSPHG